MFYTAQLYIISKQCYNNAMSEEFDNEELRPNESKTFSYVQVGQMFVGDEDLIKIEPKRGISMMQVEKELARDFHHLRIVEKDLARNTLFITGKPKTK